MAAGDVDIVDLFGRRRGGITFDQVEGGAAAPTGVAESPFDIAAVAAVPYFLAEFAQSVSYMPAAGGQREIKAIPIERGAAEGIDGMPRGLAPSSLWLVHNNATTGITSNEIQDGTDNLKIAQRIGETPMDRPILRLLKHDHAWCLIEVR